MTLVDKRNYSEKKKKTKVEKFENIKPQKSSNQKLACLQVKLQLKMNTGYSTSFSFQRQRQG